jgi:hypothetical protein
MPTIKMLTITPLGHAQFWSVRPETIMFVDSRVLIPGVSLLPDGTKIYISGQFVSTVQRTYEAATSFSDKSY